jgi:hypothetical protein
VDPAPRQDHAVGELVHPQPSAGNPSQLEKGVVLGQGQAMLRAQLIVEPPRHSRMRLQERAPGVETRIVGARRGGIGGVRHLGGLHLGGRHVSGSGMAPFTQDACEDRTPDNDISPDS